MNRNRNTVHLYFQDSDGLSDWKRNLDFPAKPYKRQDDGIWFCHRGFLRAWRELEPVIAPVVADKSIKRMVITGYSHGAAIAVLCHEYVWFHRPDLRERLEGYGFGCPRVIWGPMPEDVKRRWQTFTVIRNLDDLVTHLPPALWGFRHVGAMLSIGKRGRYSPVSAHLAKNYLKELAGYEIHPKTG